MLSKLLESEQLIQLDIWNSSTWVSSHTTSQISPNGLNQHSLLGYCIVLFQAVNMTILMNSKNPEMQKKHIQLLACRSRAITIKNLSEMSELLLNCTIVSFTAQLDNTGIAIWLRSGQRSARIAHMSQFRCSHYLGVRDHCWGTHKVPTI